LHTLDDLIEVEQPRNKYVIMEEPSKDEAAEFIKRNWRHYVILLFAFSRVKYEGRAASELSWNDHIIILKPDGTLLVHGPEKREPINWQPPGSILTSFVKEGKLIIRSRRYRPKEVVLIECEDIYVLIAMNTRSGEFRMFKSEAQMVDYVMKNPDLIEEGFIPVIREYRTRFGIIDLFGRDKENNIVVCEFKRRIADIQDVAQLALYVDAIQKNSKCKVRGILVAPGITDMALIALKEKNLEFRRLDPNKIMGR